MFEEEEEEEGKAVSMKDSAVGTEEEDDDAFNDREEAVEAGAMENEEDSEFYSNIYWKVDSNYDIDEMLKDFI